MPDPIASRLPPAAASKYRKIVAEQDEVGTVSAALQTTREALRRAHSKASANLENARSAKRPPAETHTIALLGRELAAIDAELAALEARQAALNARRSRLAQNLRVYLGSIAAVALAEYDGRIELPPAPKGAIWPDRVATERQKTNVLSADLHETASSPLPSAEIKRRAIAQINGLAERGRPSILPAVEIGAKIGFAETPLTMQVSGSSGPGVAMGSIPDAVALLCWVDRERIISLLEAEIDELADDEHALSPADRAKKESALLDQILESERVEEALIEAAEADGVSVQRRDNADPRAVLGLASSLPAPASTRR